MIVERSLSGLRALVVEDEYFIADDLKRMLKCEGADLVMLSGDVGDALGKIRADGFEFALVDLNIHGEMAFVLADELLKRGLPFGFVSGYARALIPPRFAGIPNWGKPYDVREIVGGILRLWARPAGA